MIPKSTIYQVKDGSGRIVFAGNKKDREKYVKKYGTKHKLTQQISGFLPNTIYIEL